MELRSLSVFFLDLQTTGSHPRNSEVLEIAWGKSPADFKNYLVSQESGYIPYHIQKLTGISEEDLKESRDRSDILSELKEMESLPCIIHYAQFEIPFLQSWYGEQIPFPILCTHDIARRLFPNLPTRSLKGLAGFFGHQKDDTKRSKAHIEATQIIWQGLVPELEKIGITAYEELQLWLSQDFKKKKTKYEYPLKKEIRLTLTKNPGVYRMLNRSGEVLYVGKATSLHSRVNSYFRGQKNRDTKKLEMLTQVWDIKVTECKSPLEAALLETDEIKRLDPPYNISLKLNERKLAFFSHNFDSYSHSQDDVHTIGPFSHAMALDTLRNLSHSLKNETFSSHIFHDPYPPELLQNGFDLFCRKHGVSPATFKSIRSALSLGIRICRRSKGLIAEEEQVQLEMHEEEEPTVDAVVRSEDIADKFERHFARAALAYLRARALTKLLNGEVKYPLTEGSTHSLYFQNGQQVKGGKLHTDRVKRSKAWTDLSVIDYDRMSVLYSELMKLKGTHVDN